MVDFFEFTSSKKCKTLTYSKDWTDSKVRLFLRVERNIPNIGILLRSIFHDRFLWIL